MTHIAPATLLALFVRGRCSSYDFKYIYHYWLTFLYLPEYAVVTYYQLHSLLFIISQLFDFQMGNIRPFSQRLYSILNSVTLFLRQPIKLFQCLFRPVNFWHPSTLHVVKEHSQLTATEYNYNQS
ncbi:hypothetical protein J2X94_004034 [[Curtobacterium] plantarum]|uniref:Secreted protein n=1 Tax=[Curtobacterium] plantarum TaxID=221276 RepID=A0ABT9THB8_9GAMM|nr:hypothetical protein [[Curtobacterium] plantarum]